MVLPEINLSSTLLKLCVMNPSSQASCLEIYKMSFLNSPSAVSASTRWLEYSDFKLLGHWPESNARQPICGTFILNSLPLILLPLLLELLNVYPLA